MSYLGFRLTPEGIIPGKDKLKALEKAKIPKTKEEIKSFVGLSTFSDFAKLWVPLNKATRKDQIWKSTGGKLNPKENTLLRTSNGIPEE